MNEIYGIGFRRKNKVPYCIPLSLKEIDFLTATHSLEEILNTIKENDSIVTETNPDALRIFKYTNRWRESNLDFIKKEETYILTFSFSKLFQYNQNVKLLNILYNHFSSFLTKDYIRPEFKRAILAMKENPNTFLACLSNLSYNEERMIRSYLSKKIDLKKLSLYETLDHSIYHLRKLKR